jgi:hypothetical protein
VFGILLRQFDSYTYEKVYDVSATFSHRAEKLSLPHRPSYGGNMKRLYSFVEKTYRSWNMV